MDFTLQIGKGLRNNASPYQTVMVFGADLNTPKADNWGALPSVVNQTAVFDLSTITENHEVVVALLRVNNAVEGEYTVRFRWLKLQAWEEIYTYDWTWYAGAGEWFYTYSYIGWVGWEIDKDGPYRLEVSVEGPQEYEASRDFTVTGISEEEEEEEEEPEEPEPAIDWQEAILYAIFKVAAFFRDISDETAGWGWPFKWLHSPFMWIHDQFFNLGVKFGEFFTWVREVAAKVGQVQSWEDLWNLIISYIPWLGDVGEWFQDRWAWFTSAITDWWDTVTDTVKGWIQVAVEWFNDVASAWSSFWDNLWPQLTAWVDSMAAGWDNFIKVTLPSLADWLDIEDWFESRLRQLSDFWEGWQEIRDQVFDFFRNPIDFIWDRFVDWFLGPEE